MALHKVNLSALNGSDDISTDERQKFGRLTELYGQHLEMIHVLPNHSDASLCPRGVAIEFAADAPMFTEPFHPDDFMTFGTSLVAVKGDIPKPEVLQHQSRQHKNNLLKSIQSIESAITLNRRDARTNRDERGFTYSPTIGVNSNNAMAGLVTGTSVMNNERVTRHFILVSAGLPLLSRELLRKVSTYQTFASPETSALLGNNVAVFTGPRRVSTKLRMSEFMSWDETQYAIDAGKRNRLAIAATLADKLNLKIETYTDHAAGTAALKLAMPFADTPSYELERVGSGFVYYADAVNTERVQGGLCMQYSPSMGGAFLFGLPNASNPIGTGWMNGCANAFPASTGRIMDASQAYKAVAQSDRHRFTASDAGAHPFFWHGALPYNDKLHPGTFRERDHAFRACERVLGRDPANTEYDLAPVLMLLDQTSPMKASLSTT